MESEEFLNRAMIAASLAYADGFTGTGDALIEIAFRIVSEKNRGTKPASKNLMTYAAEKAEPVPQLEK